MLQIANDASHRACNSKRSGCNSNVSGSWKRRWQHNRHLRLMLSNPGSVAGMNQVWQREDFLRQLSIVAALVVISGQALAQQAGPASSRLSNEPVVSTSVNLNVGSGKLPFCFWGSAMYSPGSHVNYYDVSKRADACFHCNADGTWDAPCQ